MKKKAMLNSTSGSSSFTGTPVSMFSCAKAPLPVIISPMIEKAMPSWASLPTKSSFAFVNPKSGPSIRPKEEDESRISTAHGKQIKENGRKTISYLLPWALEQLGSPCQVGWRPSQGQWVGRRRTALGPRELLLLRGGWRGWRRAGAARLRKSVCQSPDSTARGFLFP